MYTLQITLSLAGIYFIRFLDVSVFIPLFRLISIGPESLAALAASSCFPNSAEDE
jgi:hypothetical protein